MFPVAKDLRKGTTSVQSCLYRVEGLGARTSVQSWLHRGEGLGATTA
eukprot:gene23383-biopygen16353